MLSKAGGASGKEVALGGGEGLALLEAAVPLNASSASAYAFLATVVKEQGAVDAACGLLLKAATANPSNHSYALNHVHAHELR